MIDENNHSSLKNDNVKASVNIPINNNLSKVHDILYSKRLEMQKFMEHYVFEKMGIDKNNFLDDKRQFMLFIEFCLNTRSKVVNKDLNKGKEYFDTNYEKK